MVRRRSEAKAKWEDLNRRLSHFVMQRDDLKCVECGRGMGYIGEHHILGRGKLYPPGHRLRAPNLRKLNPKYRVLLCSEGFGCGIHTPGHSEPGRIRDQDARIMRRMVLLYGYRYPELEEQRDE